MDIHIIVSILLDYYTDMRQWSTARCLSHKCREIVSAQTYDKSCWGKRSFIQPHVCDVCERRNSNCGMINYWSPNFSCMYHIVCCPVWQCKMSAIFSMLTYLQSNRVYMLLKPFRETLKISVPRSDGSTTQGFCKTRHLVQQNGEWCVYTYWVDEANVEWNKLVPLSHYTKDPPQILLM